MLDGVKMPDNDYSNFYNTELTPQEQSSFNNWANQQSSALGRNVLNDKYDYDMQGWWKDNNGASLKGGHLTDQYKKPNHPTFSDQSQYHGINGNIGGKWNKLDNGSYTFTPGQTNLQMFDPEELNDYFSKVEPTNKLLLPQGAGNASAGS